MNLRHATHAIKQAIYDLRIANDMAEQASSRHDLAQVEGYLFHASQKDVEYIAALCKCRLIDLECQP